MEGEQWNLKFQFGSTKLINVLTFGSGDAILQSRGAHESFSTPFDEKSIHGAKRQTRLYSESAFSALTGFFNKKKPVQRQLLSPYRLFGCLLWIPYSVWHILPSFPVLSEMYLCSCSLVKIKASSQERFGRPKKRLIELKIFFKKNLKPTTFLPKTYFF